MDYFGNQLRFISFGVGLVLISRVEDSKLLHRDPILNQMVHVVGHGVGVSLEVVD